MEQSVRHRQCEPEIMSAFNIWRDNPPPRETIVWARYALTAGARGEWAATWQLVKTCKRGCCVNTYPSGMGSLLPKYWREPTPAEIESVVANGKASL